MLHCIQRFTGYDRMLGVSAVLLQSKLQNDIVPVLSKTFVAWPALHQVVKLTYMIKEANL